MSGVRRVRGGVYTIVGVYAGAGAWVRVVEATGRGPANMGVSVLKIN